MQQLSSPLGLLQHCGFAAKVGNENHLPNTDLLKVYKKVIQNLVPIIPNIPIITIHQSYQDHPIQLYLPNNYTNNGWELILPCRFGGDQLTVGSTCKGTCLGDLSHGSGESMDERD